MNRLTILLFPVLFFAGSCDNVGLAFDPHINPTGSSPTTGESAIQIVPVSGDAREGRPKVRQANPVDGGWPTAVPIVIEFSESVNEASIAPTSEAGLDGRIVLEVAGTTTVLPCLYDFLAGGRILVMRPITALSNEGNPTYEVVLLPDARDSDGLRFQVPEEGEVLTTFQVNQAESFTDGRILATYPRDNLGDAVRESDYLAFFDRPVNATSITASNFVVRPNGGSAIAGATDLPLMLLAQSDGRVVRLKPTDPFAGSMGHEFLVDETITFGASGTLDFNGRSPFAVFDTVGPQAPTAVHVGNPTAGFNDKINRQNLAALVLHVTTPSDAVAGDLIVARIYGGDPETEVTGDIAFVERTATVPAPGGQVTVTVDFAGQLGTVASPVFEDGDVDFAVQTQRGTQHSGYALNDLSDEPVLDVTPPTLTNAGPPGTSTDIYTDLEHLAFHGTASEEVGAAMLTDGVNPAAALFGSSDDGYFVCNSVTLGRLTAARSYTLTITDLAGNMGVAAITGNIVQRGVITGTLAGTLTVEAYDHATLQPISGAVVVVDPGEPVKPATGQLTAMTAANGIATFTGLATTQHTVTIVASGYNLTTFYNTTAARVSLPLRPMSDATASFSGNALFQPTAGTTVLVGNTAFDDPLLLAVPTTSADPTSIPATAITPNRSQVITAFAGMFEPTVMPAFSSHGYQMLGVTLLTTQAPAPPAAGSSSARSDIILLPSIGTSTSLAGAYTKDFSLATGLDTSNLLGGKPTVRVTTSMNGFGGQALAGVGFATLTTGASYSCNASYGLPMVTGFTGFTPSFWVVAEARDSGGRVSRHRALLIAATGALVDLIQPPGIPVITVPGGPVTGSPPVTFDDQLNAAGVPGGIAIAEIIAVDSAGRRWTVFQMDSDTTGGTKVVQFPDLSSVSVIGLATGTWTIQVDARVLLSLTSSSINNFMLSERIRQEASYARSAATTFTVQ